MVFTHHSHSGQFCGHAKNTLEEVILNAIEKRMEMIALTEHIPRDEEDLYPEEVREFSKPCSLTTFVQLNHCPAG